MTAEIQAKEWVRPHGRCRPLTIKHISEADAAFFEENKISLEVEMLNSDTMCFYAILNTLPTDPDGNPPEVIYTCRISTTPCADALSEVVKNCEIMLRAGAEE